MKRIALVIILPLVFFSLPSEAQNKPDNAKIDIMLITGDFKRAVDTCNLILSSDSLNSEIYFKLGIAYQNLLSEDKSFECFLKAVSISPDNSNYSFTVAKSYFNKGKINQAKPILLKLCAADPESWPYSYYLTNIYIQEGKYDEALKIYYPFYKKDSLNFLYADKIGYAYLKKNNFDKAIEMFSRSLELNPKNINAFKNLAFLFAAKTGAESGIKLLTKGISIDPTDMDLYARRAAIYYTVFNYKLALNDYLTLLGSGDSSVLYLKRAGIAYANNNQPQKAVDYLVKAFEKDTIDYEVNVSLAQNYMLLKDYRKSAYYYRVLIKILTPIQSRLGLNYFLLAEVLKADKQYSEAINSYLKSQEYRSDNSVFMTIANLYDEKLKDTPKAIRYYELYLRKVKSSGEKYDSDYTDSVSKRIEALKNPKPAIK